MQDANTCHIKKLWLHLKGEIFTAVFFVCFWSSNDVCFFTPYHCFCMSPAIMTDCRAKEKRKSTTSHLPSLSLCYLLLLPVFHWLNTKHACHSMQIWKNEGACEMQAVFGGFMSSFREYVLNVPEIVHSGVVSVAAPCNLELRYGECIHPLKWNYLHLSVIVMAVLLKTTVETVEQIICEIISHSKECAVWNV